MPRLEALQSLSDHYTSDPYSLSLKARKRFRTEKQIEKEKAAADDQIKGRYGLPETFALAEESEETKAQAREDWLKGQRDLDTRSRKRKVVEIGPLPSRTSSRTQPRAIPTQDTSKTSHQSLHSLRERILHNTALKRKALGGSSGSQMITPK